MVVVDLLAFYVIWRFRWLMVKQGEVNLLKSATRDFLERLFRMK